MAKHNKVTDHDELLTQCKALRTELLEQVSRCSMHIFLNV